MDSDDERITILLLWWQNLKYHAPMETFVTRKLARVNATKMALNFEKLVEWVKLYRANRTNSSLFEIMTSDLFRFYMELKWYGMVRNLINKDDEVHRLERQVNNLSDDLKKATDQRDEKKADNIQLSGQLKDLLEQLSYYKAEVSKRDAKIAELQTLPPVKQDYRYAG